MILEFKFSSTPGTIRISAPLVDLSAELRDVVGIHTSTQQIVSIGDTAEDIRKNAPEHWERNGKNIEFVHPFDFDEVRASPVESETLVAARVIQWASNNAFSRMKRNSVKRMILSPWVDRVDYDLRLEGFEKLPVATRKQFVKELTKLLVAIRRIRINGEVVVSRS